MILIPFTRSNRVAPPKTRKGIKEDQGDQDSLIGEGDQVDPPRRHAPAWAQLLPARSHFLSPSRERSARCRLVHLPPAREAGRLAGCNHLYARQLLMGMLAAGQVQRGETTTARNGTQLYWREERATGGESDERSRGERW